MIMSASETPVEGSPAVGRNVAIGIVVAVSAVVAIVIVIMFLMGTLSIPTGGSS